MPKPYHPVDTQHVLHLLRQWLKGSAPPEGVDRLDRLRDRVIDGLDDRPYVTAFAAVPRHVGRAPLRLPPEARAEALRARAGWQPQAWTAADAARGILLLSYDDSDAAAYGAMLAGLLERGADEGVSVCRALPLLPYPEHHTALAAGVIRADTLALFDALALCNPYPADALDEPAWNRMVMRAIFLDRPLDRVEGLERRGNPVLAHEIRDYARQRRATGQPTVPTLWRAIGVHACGSVAEDLATLLNGPDVEQALAAALVLGRSRDPHALEVLARRPELSEAVRSGRLTWDSLSEHRLRATG